MQADYLAQADSDEYDNEYLFFSSAKFWLASSAKLFTVPRVSQLSQTSGF